MNFLKNGCLLLLLLVVLTACQLVKTSENAEGWQEQLVGLEDANLFLEQATAKGSVVTYTTKGCVIDRLIEVGNTATIAAPGNETEEMLKHWMTVHYLDQCVFLFANIHSKNHQVTYSLATISDINNQSNLTLYGKVDEEGVLNAQAVFITSFGEK